MLNKKNSVALALIVLTTQTNTEFNQSMYEGNNPVANGRVRYIGTSYIANGYEPIFVTAADMKKTDTKTFTACQNIARSAGYYCQFPGGKGSPHNTIPVKSIPVHLEVTSPSSVSTYPEHSSFGYSRALSTIYSGGSISASSSSYQTIFNVPSTSDTEEYMIGSVQSLNEWRPNSADKTNLWLHGIRTPRLSRRSI